MLKISSNLIKELRERTNIGIAQCKQALVNSNGNIQLAIDNMRKDGLITAAKKSGRITTAGVIITQVAVNKKSGIILEINCETDFVAKNEKFNNFANTISNTALKKRITDIHTLRNHFKNEQNMLISILDENINIRRIKYLEGEFIGSYLHNQKIGVILSATGVNLNNEELIKHIAMHITANKPEYIDIQHIPADVIDHEKNIQIDIAKKSGQPSVVTQKIIEGRINKFLNEISLLNQVFIMNTKTTIANLLNENHITITQFIRFEIGGNTIKTMTNV